MNSTAFRFFLILLLVNLQICVSGQSAHYFSLPASATSDDYLHNAIIIKVKTTFAPYCSNNNIAVAELQQLFHQIGVSSVKKIFPNIKSPDKKRNEQGQKLADLSLIYELNYQSDFSVENAINLLQTVDVLEYAQPHYLVRPLDYIPNDPQNFNQYHLPIIQAYKAWDIWRGDTNTVIGIVDWGADMDHPDLVNNIKYNYNDPIDGIDNDNDGYVDNFRGWDLGDNDNNPQEIITHGCFVGGLASASTDNNIGISGTGFLCKFLPVKIADSNNQGIRAYEGIVYAAGHGCSVINCSWGDPFNTGPFGQDVVDYATINMGALVVAACGNNNNTQAFYPASYNRVLSVAATNNADVKWSGSTYGYSVDISAPGENVWSSYDGGTYGSSSGTSFSAPIVSGCAALLKSRYPNLSGLQIGERLKVSADIIDTSASNLPYKDLLGSGRVNIFKALTDSALPSVQFINQNITDANQDGVFFKNDTLLITGDFLNYLAASTSNLKVTLSCLSANTTMIDSVVNLGIINTMQTVNNNSGPFKVFLKPSVAINEELIFKLVFTDHNYRAVQYFFVEANINYLNIDTNRIATTVGSESMFAYNDGNTMQGLGFRYNHGESMLYTGGFLVGKSSTQVSDEVYSATNGFDHHFHSVKNIRKINSPALSPYEAEGIFNDSLALNARLNVLIKQHVFAWTSAPKDKYIIVQYTIINKDAQILNNLYAGLFMDWEIGNNTKNRIGFDALNKMGYCYSLDGGNYTGISLLTPGSLFHYGFDNDGANGSIQINDGFTAAEKYTALKSTRNNAGMSANGNNVSEMMSSGPFNLAVDDSVVVAFALLAGDNFNDLQNSAGQALQGYYQTAIAENQDGKSDDVVLFQNEPNPFSNSTTISFYLGSDMNVELSYTDSKGANKQIIYQGSLSKGVHSFQISNKLSPGVYIYTLNSGNYSIKKKMCVIK